MMKKEILGSLCKTPLKNFKVNYRGSDLESFL